MNRLLGVRTAPRPTPLWDGEAGRGHCYLWVVGRTSVQFTAPCSPPQGGKVSPTERAISYLWLQLAR